MSMIDQEGQLTNGLRILDGGIVEITTRIGTVRAARWDGLVIEQGRRFVLPIIVKDDTGVVDLSTGWTADLQAKKTRGGSAVLTLAEGATNDHLLLADGTNDRNITAIVRAVTTQALTFTRAFYELTITRTSDSLHVPLLWGACALRTRVVAP